MRKIILIFLVSVSVVFGQEELISCYVDFVNINRYMGAWFEDYDRAYYYARYNSTTKIVEWVRIQTNQFVYRLQYIKGNRRINAYAIWDEELETFYGIKTRVFSKTEYGVDVEIDGILCDNGDWLFLYEQYQDLRVARVDRRFGDVIFEREGRQFDDYTVNYFSVNNLKRAYKIYQYNLDLEPKANKTGIVKYENGQKSWVFATEFYSGNAFTQEDIDNINKAEQLIPLWASNLIFTIGLNKFDSFWEFAQQNID